MAAVRVARAEDFGAVLELLRHFSHDDPPADLARAEAAWAALLDNPALTLFVAEAGGAPVATCTLVVVPNLTRGARPFALIENVITHPNHRRTGLGRAVLAAAQAKAWEAGCYKVSLATGSAREDTLRLYEGAGFERNAKTFFEVRRR